LEKEIDANLAKADLTIPEGQKLRALIGPHAGFAYSGPNAAWGYKNIDADGYDRIVLMGPSHKVYLDFVAQTACQEYATPLGNIPIDRATVKKLEEASSVAKFDQVAVKYEENEHSLEMHCPYIRKIFKDKNITMVPLMVGDLPKEAWQEYAKALLPLFEDERTLFVVSSDFCHWGERFDF
jgi:AmmeMemoRadiSam system protein B